jgi:hypothetical protein
MGALVANYFFVMLSVVGIFWNSFYPFTFPVIFKAMSQPSIFDVEYQLDKINQINDFLRRLDELIDWSVFLDLLNQVRSPEKKSNAGCPAFDVLLMFKILVLKTVDNLSDDQTELQIRDRLSFRAFWVLILSTRFPIPKRLGCLGNS